MLEIYIVTVTIVLGYFLNKAYKTYKQYKFNKAYKEYRHKKLLEWIEAQQQMYNRNR